MGGVLVPAPWVSPPTRVPLCWSRGTVRGAQRQPTVLIYVARYTWYPHTLATPFSRLSCLGFLGGVGGFSTSCDLMNCAPLEGCTHGYVMSVRVLLVGDRQLMYSLTHRAPQPISQCLPISNPTADTTQIWASAPLLQSGYLFQGVLGCSSARPDTTLISCEWASERGDPADW